MCKRHVGCSGQSSFAIDGLAGLTVFAKCSLPTELMEDQFFTNRRYIRIDGTIQTSGVVPLHY